MARRLRSQNVDNFFLCGWPVLASDVPELAVQSYNSCCNYMYAVVDEYPIRLLNSTHDMRPKDSFGLLHLASPWSGFQRRPHHLHTTPPHLLGTPAVPV